MAMLCVPSSACADAPPAPIASEVTREIVADKKLLHFPVHAGAAKRTVKISAGGELVRSFDIELADGNADWWAPADVSAWTGKKLSVVVDALPVGSKALDALRLSDTLLGSENLYREALRPQLHFSAKRGWINDPNGLAFFNGEYHLFFQHNPYGCAWGNMQWGHASSRDLVHWQEHGDVLYPDNMGPMFSGSAAVDWQNTSGFGQDGEPPLVLIYTAAGNPTTQCLAYTTDGRKVTKFASNPVVKQITGGNRDPKVFWHAPTRKWIMVLYVGLPNPVGTKDAQGNPTTKHTIHFFTSPNLRDWTQASVTDGGTDGNRFLFECPDFFELPVDGDASNKKWVITAANSEYCVGTFDGTTFRPDSSKLAGVYGRGFYAAQTFSDIPDGRRIQIGWCQADSPNMPFNQLQSLPMELSLRTTPNGLRIARQPVKELTSLRDGPDQAHSLTTVRAGLIELRAEFEPGDAGSVEFNLRGAKITYDARKQELIVNDVHAPAPLVDGRQHIIVFVDRTMLEVFASDGLTYVPLPFIPKEEDQSITQEIKGGNARMTSLQAYKLKSIWE